eukprot:CAMPEP_0206441684 /NCGR_PEP_ID=MMETSP0324_2-20121206/13412_1 /ASSEMBLY_ACC=CAM_ASM_000836 /TAXON_ID=2866 /ORGANISM="Crypthecodinium cohnii, Strain Seligo" /LENGTH=212 /DNA_ID=CAMNT_0053909461 /DNA_START=64 /DNA_END=702 /DNA_ORIENTATION=-
MEQLVDGHLVYVPHGVDLSRPWYGIRDSDGYPALYCLLCMAYCCEGHVASRRHHFDGERVGASPPQATRLVQPRNLGQEEGLPPPPPPQPWLCYRTSPSDGVPWLYCLMCRKWVDDCELEDISNYEGAHGFESSQNLQAHARNLANLDRFKNEEWWQEAEDEDTNDLQPGWHVARDVEGVLYYYHDDGRSQREHPSTPLHEESIPEDRRTGP